MGLNEGPGQAVSIGRLWEAEGLANAPSIGATMASLGFLVAYAGGVIVARRVRRSDRTRPAAAVPAPARGNLAGPTGATVESDAATSSQNRRSIVVTALAVAAGYAAIYLLVRWVTGLIGPDVQDLVLAVLFFVCLLIGMAIRSLLGRARVELDDGALRTVTVWAVDGLTIAILGSLAWEDVSEVAVPMAIVVALAVAATATAIWIMGRRLPTLRVERQLALFGTVTGTAASGLALIAMVDPEMETSASAELGAAVVVSTPVVLGGIAITTLAATGTLSLISTIAVLIALVAFSGAVQWWIVRRLTRPG
jgi:ESS family glutamate:Na+ symporter